MELGVGPEVVVGLCMERGVEMVVGLLGVLKAGGAYLPLDPAYPPDRIAFMLEDACARVLLTQDEVAGRLAASMGGRALFVLRLDTEWERLAALPGENPRGERAARQPRLRHLHVGLDGRAEGRNGHATARLTNLQAALDEVI